MRTKSHLLDILQHLHALTTHNMHIYTITVQFKLGVAPELFIGRILEHIQSSQSQLIFRYLA